ncbi:MAG: hypothetical protein M3R25_12410 [Bacteroidota bacterium]|nr:hypothetical protein [Bacteroidota bacterium]
MKTFLISSILLLAISTYAQGPVRFAFKFGVSPGNNTSGQRLIINRTNPLEEFRIGLSASKQQLFGEVSAHVKLNGHFFLESGIGYTRAASVYKLDFQMLQPDMPSKEMYMRDSKNLLLLPVQIGVVLGKLEVLSGFRATHAFSSKNELTHVKGFSGKSSGVGLGWQFGARYPIRNTLLGVDYHGNFQRVGTGMIVNNQSLEIMNIPGQWVFNIQYRL